MHARAYAHVDDIIGAADRIFVMLDDQDTVADVAQMLERFDQSVIVALMQADRRFVQYIHDAGQAGTNLRCQTNTLCFTARQGVGTTVQR